jgi:geranylgeranyl pyrophosphate synthase
MNFAEYRRSIQTELDQELMRWVGEFSREFSTKPPEPMRQALEDGKRVRGGLTCLVSQALGGEIAAAIPRAVAIECIQAACLIHDDYVDQDTTRRNRRATWTVEGPRKAVLLGDIIFATAIQRMFELGRADGIVIAQAIATIAKGAYQEPLHPEDFAAAVTNGGYRPEFYNQIIHLKTGTLFGAAAKLGAIAAGAMPDLAAHAFEFGARLGEAYQIMDDLHDSFELERKPNNPQSIIPALLYFSPMDDGKLARLLKKQESGEDWIEAALPDLKRRMRNEIGVRLSSAENEIRDFPDNAYTRLLRAAPAEIVQMLEIQSFSDSEVSNIISGR